MTKGSSTPPSDEFDLVAPTAAKGVHRRPRSAWARVAPFVAAIVLAPVAAYFLVNAMALGKAAFVPGNGELDDPSTSASASATRKPTTTTSPSPTTSAPASETPSAPQTPKPDLATSVTVFNSTNTSGLARKAADRLKAAGWSKVVAANYSGAQPESTVFYARAELESTARQAAEDLGITRVELSKADAEGGLAVVLESDYRS